MDSLVKRAIATMFVAFLVLFAFTNAWGQATGTSQPQIARIRTLQIDAWARPGVGQFAPADDLAQYLVYELYVTNWKVRIFASLRWMLKMPRRGSLWHRVSRNCESAQLGQRRLAWPRRRIDRNLRPSSPRLAT